jgi:hypothetical protein
MSLRLISRSVSAGGIARSVTTPALALAVTWAALLSGGCGAGVVSAESSGTTTTDQESLLAVQACQAQARACMSSGGGSACEDKLRACLSSSLPPDVDSTPERVSHEAGQPEAEEDAHPEHPDPEPAEKPDAGRRALPDAAVSALTNPVGRADAGPAVLSCVDALRSCLASGAKPSTCAETARGCFTAAHDNDKH